MARETTLRKQLVYAFERPPGSQNSVFVLLVASDAFYEFSYGRSFFVPNFGCPQAPILNASGGKCDTKNERFYRFRVEKRAVSKEDKLWTNSLREFIDSSFERTLWADLGVDQKIPR